MDEIIELGMIGDPEQFGILVTGHDYEDGTRSIEIEVFARYERQAYYVNDLAEMDSLLVLLQQAKDYIQNG